jgi:lon-related putative ATP-dependent protease
MNSLREPLPPQALYRRCDPQQFTFETTAELEDLTDIIGHDRAIEAIHFGIGIRRSGYNMFALGPSSLDKHGIIRRFLEEKAATEPARDDWCYVNNFDATQKPRYLRLPPGKGAEFRQDVARLVDELRSAIQAVFESEGYRTRKQAIIEELKEKRESAIEAIRREAESKSIALLETPTGFALALMRDGSVISPEEFHSLPQEERERISTEIESLQEQLRGIMEQAPQWERETRDKLRKLNREVTTFAVGHLIDELRAKYQDLPAVAEHLDAMRRDVIENADLILNPPKASLADLLDIPQQALGEGSALMRRYQVNLLVDNRDGRGAPVVYEDNPTFQNLIGQIEYLSHLGALVTDFNFIRAGALHKANGGYLMLDAHKLLTQPFAWEAIKRALRSAEVRIESLGHSLGLTSAASLEPQPIPLDVKVVLLGERLLYYLLCHYDLEFNELFKVAVDFEDEVDRGDENHRRYASLIGAIARREKLLPFDRKAVARVIEHSSRLAGDAEKLSAQTLTVADLLREADYLAGAAGRSVVGAEDVQSAIDAQTRRADRMRRRIQEEIERGMILIATEGRRIGQVNGLSVVELDKFAFGRPSRITARVRMGKGEVIDIEREVELGGPIHSKGVLILTGFLGARYAPDHPLSLGATLVFEQSYGGVEGDSASAAELCALLSALAEVPINQSFAVTGSVNQHGEAQAVGGVNEKIEGFYDLCKARGLTGEQGVLIPASNTKRLMLRQEVVEAVAAGKFHVYAVETIDQGMEILTGLPAGERDASGVFPADSVNYRVEARLRELAAKRAAYGKLQSENER